VAIYICCKRLFKIFPLFQTYVANVLFGCCLCCSCYTNMLQAYVANVSPVSHKCCRSASCCDISRRRKRAHTEAVPMGAAVPSARQAKRAWMVPSCMRFSRHEGHNCMHRRTSMREWVCKRSNCVRGRMCRRTSCMRRMCRRNICLRGRTFMQDRLSSMRGERDMHNRRGRRPVYKFTVRGSPENAGAFMSSIV
jgi:hypothetical protein